VARFLRFAAFFAALVAILVLVVLPLVLGPLLAQTVRGMGLRSDTLDVSVAPFDPFLVLGRSRRVNVVAEGVDMQPAQVGRAELGLIETSFFDRSFEAVDGRLTDVAISAGGTSVQATEIVLEGSAENAIATARLTPEQAAGLVLVAAGRAGAIVDDVRFTDSGVAVVVGGRETAARLRVAAGALLLEPTGGGQIVLIQPAPSDAWRLQEAWVSPGGLNIRGEVDVSELVSNLGG
jgi:hypothetical protein